MFEAFLNPWSMAAGLALISAPIIIHLINRMRFKRIRWAAMEFLLKAQKRMRRKMIIEQLILLALRCLLVALVGLLVGRYLGFSTASKEARTTAHVVVLDDSPSMADFWRGEDGQTTDSFAQAKKQLVGQIVPAASQATSPQTLELLRLSELSDPRPFGRLNAETNKEIESYLGQFQPSTVRVGLSEGLRRAKERLDAQAETDVARVVHVLSDFRSVDWAQDGEAIRAAVKDLTGSQVKVNLIDVAHPYRRDDKKVPLFHENVGIVELRPRARVVARDRAVEFLVRVKNFGNAEMKDVRCAILVNGNENAGLSLYIPTLPANQDVPLTFSLQFSQTTNKDRPLDRFNVVTARLELTEPGGLLADNVRHTVVEVRDRLNVLIVEGRPQMRELKEGDSLYLRRMLRDSFGGIDLANGTAHDLETQDLRRYASIYLLNVPSLTEAAVKNLEGYVHDGGGVGLFLGPDVRPAEYNKGLYNAGKGLFPVPLPDKPTDPPTEEERLVRRFGAFNKKIQLRSPAIREHPAVKGMYTDELGRFTKDNHIDDWVRAVFIDRHWPVKRLGAWREDGNVQELFTLPNEQPMADFEKPVVDILRRLPLEEPKYQKYKKYLEKLKTNIRATVASSSPLPVLAQQLDWLLCDQINDGDESEPLLREFWSLPEMADLRAETMRLRETVKYGDPLYLAKQFGLGRVTVVLTPVGEGWNEWAFGNEKSKDCFVAVMAEMQKYLAGGGSDENLSVGSELRLTFDPNLYQPTASRTLLTFEGSKDKATPAGPSPLTITKLGEQALTSEGGRLTLAYKEAVKPGVYAFTLTRLKDPKLGPDDQGDRPEYVAYAFNIDAAREGDLRRVSRDDVAQIAEKVPLYSPDDTSWTDELKQKSSDLSSGRWLYLILLLVLVVEQAMAVRLSYHTQPGELEAHAPTAAAALHRAGAVMPPMEREPAGAA